MKWLWSEEARPFALLIALWGAYALFTVAAGVYSAGFASGRRSLLAAAAESAFTAKGGPHGLG